MYKQVKPFNQNTAGKLKGFCLQNVRKGYGIASKYANAITAWNNTQQHKDRSIPSGVAVPLFYTYKTDGHINVQLPDGRVWSDGDIYANLSTYEKGHPTVHYLGWGESVNAERVIEHVADPVAKSFRVTPGHTFRIYKPGTTTVLGTIDNSWGWYQIRGVDPKFPNRWLMLSAKYGKASFPWANIKMQPYTGEYETK